MDPRIAEALRQMPARALNGVPTAGYRGMDAPAATTLTSCNTQRVNFAGGVLASYLTPEMMTPLERTWRKSPEDGIFSASPARPFTFELGSIHVPVSMAFVLLDYRFDIYRPSAVSPGDTVPLESRRLSTQVGWDLVASNKRQGNVEYELIPSQPSPDQSAFGSSSFVNGGIIPGTGPSRATQDQFNAAAANNAQVPAGPGLAILPQRHHREGLLQSPVPWVVRSSDTLQARCIVFNAVKIPIAFFESEIFGFLTPQNILDEMLKAVAPCAPIGGP